MSNPSGAIKEAIDRYLRDGIDLINSKDGNIAGNPILSGGTTSSVSPTFGGWNTADADNPATISIEATVETDGTTNGEVVVAVDEDGDDTADYTYTVAFADSAQGASTETNKIDVYVPEGGSYEVRNVSDPAATNAIGTVRQLTL